MQQTGTPVAPAEAPSTPSATTVLDLAAVAALQRRVENLVDSGALTEAPYYYHR